MNENIWGQNKTQNISLIFLGEEKNNNPKTYN